MRMLNDISIKRKLMVLTMLSVLTAMLLACTAFVVNDYFLLRRNMQQQLIALSDVLGANSSAAIQFQDVESAEQILASLELEPIVTSAVLFIPSGEVFATYPKEMPNAIPFSSKEEMSFNYQRGSLQVSRRIEMNNEWIGTLCLEGDLTFIWNEFQRYLLIGCSVIFISLVAAGVLGSKLQRIISQPILELTKTAQTVSENDDYSLRVEKQGNDELGDLCTEFNSMMDQIVSSKAALVKAHDELELRVDERTKQLSEFIKQLHNEIQERERAEKELEKVHREFVDAARQAGMAEVAIGVLHNVGNVLNSVNTSASLLFKKIQNSKSERIVSVVDLLDQHKEDLGCFLTENEKGKQVPKFLRMLADHFMQEEKNLLEETEHLLKNVEHIKRIISTQQSLAKSGGLVEKISLNGFLEDAVKLNATSFARHGIQVEREYGDIPEIVVDKHKVLQIVINLIKNAKESLMTKPPRERSLTLRTTTEDDFLCLEVIDTGMGIDEAHLAKIFNHGFTTKKDGHGFGLHSCANAATEMGGTLSAQSEGPGKGARLILRVPLKLASLVESAPA